MLVWGGVGGCMRGCVCVCVCVRALGELIGWVGLLAHLLMRDSGDCCWQQEEDGVGQAVAHIMHACMHAQVFASHTAHNRLSPPHPTHPPTHPPTWHSSAATPGSLRTPGWRCCPERCTAATRRRQRTMASRRGGKGGWRGRRRRRRWGGGVGGRRRRGGGVGGRRRRGAGVGGGRRRGGGVGGRRRRGGSCLPCRRCSSQMGR
jgi:hypothetical protein